MEQKNETTLKNDIKEVVNEFKLPNQKNVINGKAFEYALAYEFYDFLKCRGIPVKLIEDRSMNYAKFCFDSFSDRPNEQNAFSISARSSIFPLIKLEPGLTQPANERDLMTIRLANDREGEAGDVRDVIFAKNNWEVGFSAKNNNDDVKHSRLSTTIDFGQEWLGYPVSNQYWSDIRPIFSELSQLREQDKDWNEIDNKAERFYKPVLTAFKNEILRLAQQHEDVPEKLILYLLGRKPFYKIIKYDTSKMVVVKAFNFKNGLNKTVNGVRAEYKTPEVKLPTRIVEIEWKIKDDNLTSTNTLDMILDRGWEISFRLHNGDGRVKPSLKFAVQLLGNPPVLFTQYIFSED